MSFSQDEKDHYSRMVGMIIGGNRNKKAALDSSARLALAAVRASMPGITDDMLVAFLASVAVILARILASPLQDAAGVAETVFDNYTLAAASVMGAYDMDSPEVPEYAPPPAQPDGSDRAKIDTLMNRAYL
jgi:hypothetical protein